LGLVICIEYFDAGCGIEEAHSSSNEVDIMTRVAILVGGPDDLPPEDRVRTLNADCDVIHCEYGANVETFRFCGERIPFDPSVLIYEWAGTA
jgi:hypothetical protein